MSKTFILKSDDTVQIFKPLNGENFSLDEMQKAVGGLIQVVNIPHTDLIMVINEEGVLFFLPKNHMASAIVRQDIVGNVIIMPSAMMN